MLSKGFLPFADTLNETPQDTDGSGLTKIGAFAGAFSFVVPNVGSFFTASASANAEVCV
jgi:hypothetical protein